MLQDIQFALRRLRKAPAFTATAILTLALGIGATTAIFTLIYQVMLRPLPVEHPAQLYKLGKEIECCVTGGLQDDWRLFSYDLYTYLRDQTPGTEGVAAVDAASTLAAVRREGDSAAALALSIRFISGNYFSVMKTKPFQGRLLQPGDDREGAPPVAVMTHRLWRTRFASDPKLVGRTLLLTGHPVTVVGITAEGFLGERNEPDPPGLWLTLSQEPVIQPERHLRNLPESHWLDLILRIDHSKADPKAVPSVQLAIQNALGQWIRAHQEYFGKNATDKEYARQTTELVPAASGINSLNDRYAHSLNLLMLVAGFVLLIACANLANLLLVRGMARGQEVALRSALGAPRASIVRSMLVEALLLAVLGGIAAIGVAYAGSRAILNLAMPEVQTNPISATPSPAIIAFAFSVSVLTGILFGAGPAWIASRSAPAEALRGANRGTREAGARPQKLLVILQAALSLALLSVAGVLISSLRRLEHQNFHFETQGRLVAFVDLQAAGYKYEGLANLYQRMDDVIGHLPGIDTFAYATYSPMADNNWSTGVAIDGKEPSRGTLSSYSCVSAHYFQAVGTRLLRGRLLDEHDTATGRHVAVINSTFATKLLPGKQPIGEHFGPDREHPGEFEIVGVVDDSKYGDPAKPSYPMFFTPITQTTTYTKPGDIAGENFKHFASNLVIHYQGDSNAAAADVRNALKAIDPQIPITKLTTYQDQVSGNFTQEELVVRLTSLFGILALVLASLGLYGVTTYTVARRTNEIGIRMALGANRFHVLLMVIESALKQVGTGLALGVPLTYGAARLLEHTLYETSAFQPAVVLAVIALMLVCALAAAAIPARRAASIEPTQALRAE